MAGGNLILLKIKLLYQRWRVGKDYEKLIKKNGHLVFKKKQEVIMNYLNANKQRDDSGEKYWKGYLDALDFFLKE